MTAPKSFGGFSEDDARRELEEQRKEEERKKKEEEDRKKAEERRKKLEEMRKKREEEARRKAEAERLRKEAEEERKKPQNILEDIIKKYPELNNKEVFGGDLKNYENKDMPNNILGENNISNETLEKILYKKLPFINSNKDKLKDKYDKSISEASILGKYIDSLYGKKDDDDKPGSAGAVTLPYYDHKKDDDDKPPEATGGMPMPLILSAGGSL